MSIQANNSMTPNNIHVELRPGMVLKKRTYGRTEEWWMEEQSSASNWGWVFMLLLFIGALYFMMPSKSDVSKSKKEIGIESVAQR